MGRLSSHRKICDCTCIRLLPPVQWRHALRRSTRHFLLVARQSDWIHPSTLALLSIDSG